MIKFVREYSFSGKQRYFDVAYENPKCRYGMRINLYGENDLPKTVRKFIAEATKVREQDDKYHGKEIIYEA